MDKDTYLIRISGKAELPEAINIGSNYHLSLEGSITSKTTTDEENGSFVHTFLFRPIKMELLDPLGKTLKLKDTRTLSQQFRAIMWRNWKERDESESFEEVVYPRLMRNMLNSAADVYEMFNK